MVMMTIHCLYSVRPYCILGEKVFCMTFDSLLVPELQL